jgi:hypothetical protein
MILEQIEKIIGGKLLFIHIYIDVQNFINIF